MTVLAKESPGRARGPELMPAGALMRPRGPLGRLGGGCEVSAFSKGAALGGARGPAGRGDRGEEGQSKRLSGVTGVTGNHTGGQGGSVFSKGACAPGRQSGDKGNLVSTREARVSAPRDRGDQVEC